MKTLNKNEVFDIIHAEIKKTMHNKNEYIKKNGFSHPDVINSFDSAIASLSGLYGAFERAYLE